jgi:hypothetical protein
MSGAGADGENPAFAPALLLQSGDRYVTTGSLEQHEMLCYTRMDWELL